MLVKRLFWFQLSLMLVLSLLFVFWQGTESGVSALLGGITGIVPSLLFSWLYFKHGGAQDAKKVVQAFYLGETLKIVTTVVLFTASFQWSKLKPVPMFIVFISVALAYWAIPWLLQDKIQDKINKG